MIEVKINKEISDYQETLFFGLTMRQFVCSALSVVIALLFYILLHKVLGRELVSWFCILGALPVAIAGFFKYHGMTFERFLWAWLKSEVFLRGTRIWKSVHLYDLMQIDDEEMRDTTKLESRKRGNLHVSKQRTHKRTF